MTAQGAGDAAGSPANARASGLDPATRQRWKAGVAAERDRRAPPDGFPRLPDIPAGRYTDPAFFELERDALFRRGWVYAAHTSQLPAVGSYVVVRHTGAPILIVRGEDGTLRAFYNTCRHRGAPVAREDAGSAPGSLTCGYHGWTYRLDGTLKAVTDPRDFVDLDLECLGLVPVRCATLGSLVFMSEDAQGESFEQFVEPIARYFRHLPMQDLVLVHQHSVEVAGHYKVVLENFLEAYHFRLLHQKTTHRIFDHTGTSVHLWRHGHSMMLTPHRRPDWVDPGTVGMASMPGATEIERNFNPSYCLFPNLILPIADTGVPCVAIWPITADRTLMQVMWFAPGWGDGPRPALWDTRIANFERIVDEDVSFVAPIQASIGTPGFRGVPLSYQERRIYHWHEALDRRIGVERIPPRLRVAQVLADWVGD
jgi:phenylpropionate dioxygenase-like ring-hydroxylating dioxygenase large terminal subunit